MLDLELHLRIAGVLLLVVLAANVVLPVRYAWPAKLGSVEDVLVRQVFFVHLLFIALLVAGMAALCLAFPGLLLDGSPLARLLAGGLALFWGLRLLVQVLVYDAGVWRGKRLETAGHVGFAAVWAYLAGVFAAVMGAQA